MNAAPEDERLGAAPPPDSVAVHPIVAADAAVGRVAARLGVEYVLRTLQLMNQMAGDDLVTSIVLYTVLAGNVLHLDKNPRTANRFDSLEDSPPDAVRRPISVLSVSGSLGLPYETVRRHVKKLVKRGRLVRVKGGLVGPSAAVEGPGQEAAMLANVANVRRFYRALKRAGFQPD
jgi:hypothetical protein